MTARPWIISVLSTDYDLHNVREAVIKQLQGKGICVSAFELPDFPVEPDIHSHDSCLIALDRVDVALMIIDKRFGGIYIGETSHSITEEEYLSVVRSGKPCLVFVSKRTWEERYQYKTQLKEWTNNPRYSSRQKKNGVPKAEFDKKYACTYVESIRTIELVESIQKAYQDFSASNWIDQYEDVSDLLVRIEGKLKGLSRFLLECLIKEQKKKIESRHTSTGLSLSIGDVFSRGYYLEPSYSQESGDLQSGASLNDMIRNTLLSNSSVLIYGEAGYGKTTILAKSYISHVNEFLKKDSYHIPFYLWLKKKTCDYHFDFSTYINDSFRDDWGKEVYPYIDLRNIRPYFYFDGFDEIAEKMTPSEVERISRADIFSHPILLTCRQQYAYRYINNFNFSDKFAHKVKINTWDTSMAKSYIDNFCRIKGKGLDFANVVHKLLADNHALRDILNSPLLITMLLWIVEQNRMRIPETIRTRVELFKECVNELAKRELTRLEQSEAFAPELVVVWSNAAWEVYCNKLKNAVSKLSVIVPKLKKLLPSIKLEYSESHFEALFDSSGDEIFGTFHEQFLEFLVANTIFIACCDSIYPYPEFLSYVMRPEINRYFRAIWSESIPDVKAKVVNNLHEQYLHNLGDDSYGAVSKRVHAIYHLARFDLPERQDILNKAFHNETHISVRLSLFFGAIKMGRLDDEQRFFELLKTDSNINEANRGYHIAYYSDAIMADQLPFQDNIQKKWEGTLRAFLRHFSSDELEHYFLRRIDLVTMKHLAEARKVIEPLSPSIIDELEKLVASSCYSCSYPELQLKIESAFTELKEVVARIQSAC